MTIAFLHQRMTLHVGYLSQYTHYIKPRKEVISYHTKHGQS